MSEGKSQFRCRLHQQRRGPAAQPRLRTHRRHQGPAQDRRPREGACRGRQRIGCLSRAVAARKAMVLRCAVPCRQRGMIFRFCRPPENKPRLTRRARRSVEPRRLFREGTPVARQDYLFTSESVSEGHPDKVCDRISDEIVDLVYREAKKVGMDPLGGSRRLRDAGDHQPRRHRRRGARARHAAQEGQGRQGA